MKKLILFLFILLQTSTAYSAEAAKTTSISKEVYYKFIKNQNPRISSTEAKEILSAVQYYNPRYFAKFGEEGIKWTLSIIAGESSFRNVKGDLDKGVSHGYMQIQQRTADEAAAFCGIRRVFNIDTLWDNVHLGMCHLYQLNSRYNNFMYSIIAYNNGASATSGWLKRGTIDTKVEYLSWIMSKKRKLARIEKQYAY